MALNLQALLKAMTDKGASDLHVTVGSPPRLRIDGELVKLQTEPLTPVDTKTLCYSVMNDAQKLRFEEDLEIDFSFGIRNMARFRANVYMQQACVAGAFRVVPYQIIPLEELGSLGTGEREVGRSNFGKGVGKTEAVVAGRRIHACRQHDVL